MLNVYFPNSHRSSQAVGASAECSGGLDSVTIWCPKKAQKMCLPLTFALQFYKYFLATNENSTREDS